MPNQSMSMNDSKGRLYRGRPVLVQGKSVFFGRKDTLFLLEDGRVRRIVRIPGSSPLLRLAPRLVDRLLRNEISHCLPVAGGTLLVCYRNSLYRVDPDSGRVLSSYRLKRGSRPLGIAVENGGWVVFGEYGTLPRSESVPVLAARLPDFDFKPVFSFAPGEVKHIHNVVWDRFESCYWVLTGDLNGESGILRLDADFRERGWLIRGSQLCRAVNVFVREGDLLYGTDSETAENWIVKVDKRSGEITRIAPIVGSSLHCSILGGNLLVSAAVEPSVVNLARQCIVYRSTDGEHWEKMIEHQKDVWLSPHFQFGTHVLPKGIGAEVVAIGGQAIKGLDGRFLTVFR